MIQRLQRISDQIVILSSEKLVFLNLLMFYQCASAPEMMRPLWLIGLSVPRDGDSTEQLGVLEASSTDLFRVTHQQHIRGKSLIVI